MLNGAEITSYIILKRWHEELNFWTAADRLYISNRDWVVIATLEEELSVTLFWREISGMSVLQSAGSYLKAEVGFSITNLEYDQRTIEFQIQAGKIGELRMLLRLCIESDYPSWCQVECLSTFSKCEIWKKLSNSLRSGKWYKRISLT